MISRQQLRKLIYESITNEVREMTVPGMEADKKYPGALKFKESGSQVAKNVKAGLEKELTGNFDMENYFIWSGHAEEYMQTQRLGRTGPKLGISGKNDPYTYKKLSGGKYRVISGPIARAIGKIFTPKKKISGGEEQLAATKDISFTYVRSDVEFNDHVRGLASGFGLSSNYSTTSDNKVINAAATKNGISKAIAGNIGFADVKDAMIEVGEGLGKTIIAVGFTKENEKFKVYIAYTSDDMPNYVVIEQTGLFDAPSAGEESGVKPDETSIKPPTLTESRGTQYRNRYFRR